MRHAPMTLFYSFLVLMFSTVHCMAMAPDPPPPTPPPPPGVPIDGPLAILLLAAMCLGIYKLYKFQNKTNARA